MDGLLWKVKALIDHVKQVSKEAWLFSKFISTDEKIVSYQFWYLNKKKITYKCASDDFQADAVYNQG